MYDVVVMESKVMFDRYRSKMAMFNEVTFQYDFDVINVCKQLTYNDCHYEQGFQFKKVIDELTEKFYSHLDEIDKETVKMALHEIAVYITQWIEQFLPIEPYGFLTMYQPEIIVEHKVIFKNCDYRINM